MGHDEIYIYITEMTKTHILSMSDHTGYHQYNLLLPLKATWNMSTNTKRSKNCKRALPLTLNVLIKAAEQ